MQQVILDFGSKKLFVKEIFFLGCRHLGWAKSMDKDSMLLPEEVIDLVEEQTEGNINRRNVFNFQKIYFLLLSLFSIRKCFYIQHYLIKRNETGYTPIHDILDLESLGKITDRYVRDHQRNGLLAFPRFAVSSITKILNRSGISLAKDMMIMNTLFRKGFDLSKAPRKFILLGFISTCDPLIFDKTIADNCGKGEISMDQGVFSSGACANIARERSVKP